MPWSPRLPGGFARIPADLDRTDPVLVGLYGVAALGMGAFVGIFNAIGFRLEGPPYNFPVALAGLVFLVYPIGSVASTAAGRLAARFTRRRVVPAAAP